MKKYLSIAVLFLGLTGCSSDYIDGFKISQKEFQNIKDLDQKSRSFFS